MIHSLEDLNESFCPAEYSFRKTNNHVLYIHVFFEEGDFAANVESIAIDSDLHIKLYYKGFPIPLLHLLHNVHEKDEHLTGNLKKAFKLSHATLHPGNNKQSVPLAFHGTTSAAIISYFPNETAAAELLKLSFVATVPL